MSPIETVSRLFTRARQSTGSLVVQVLSMALAVGMGVYGESLWQDRLQRQQTQQLVTAIGGEIDRNTRYVQHLIKIAAFQSRSEMIEEGFTPLRNDDLKIILEFFEQELARGQAKLMWNSAQYRQEFGLIDIRCIGLIDLIYRAYDQFLLNAEKQLVPALKDFAFSEHPTEYARRAKVLFDTSHQMWSEQLLPVETSYSRQFKELTPEEFWEPFGLDEGSLPLETCDLRSTVDTSKIGDNKRYTGGLNGISVYDGGYAPFSAWRDGFNTVKSYLFVIDAETGERWDADISEEEDAALN